MKRHLSSRRPSCSPRAARYGMRVPDALVKKLPYETRIELLEAENDLALAIDKVDEARATRSPRPRQHPPRHAPAPRPPSGEVDRAEDAVSQRGGPARHRRRRRRAWSTCARGSELNVALQERGAARAALRLRPLRAGAADGRPQGEGGGQRGAGPEGVRGPGDRVRRGGEGGARELGEDSAEEKAAREAWEAKKAALAKKTFDARASPTWRTCDDSSRCPRPPAPHGAGSRAGAPRRAHARRRGRGAAELPPRHGRALQAGRGLPDQGQPKKAVAPLQEAAGEGRRTSSPREVALARALRLAGDADEARDAAGRLHRHVPEESTPARRARPAGARAWTSTTWPSASTRWPSELAPKDAELQLQPGRGAAARGPDGRRHRARTRRR